MKQQTLNKSFSLKGPGLHTGKDCKITFFPAPVNHGIKFKRTDVEDSTLVKADVARVSSTVRCTTIGKEAVSYTHLTLPTILLV